MFVVPRFAGRSATGCAGTEPHRLPSRYRDRGPSSRYGSIPLPTRLSATARSPATPLSRGPGRVPLPPLRRVRLRSAARGPWQQLPPAVFAGNPPPHGCRKLSLRSKAASYRSCGLPSLRSAPLGLRRPAAGRTQTRPPTVRSAVSRGPLAGSSAGAGCRRGRRGARFRLLHFSGSRPHVPLTRHRPSASRGPLARPRKMQPFTGMTSARHEAVVLRALSACRRVPASWGALFSSSRSCGAEQSIDDPAGDETGAPVGRSSSKFPAHYRQLPTLSVTFLRPQVQRPRVRSP